ncbi:MAG: hypothetical protein JSW20_09785 [Nitrospiraceae bacterium]|nr:MAG: hypothetical protein JSW20_09785 [Nitrospiraceae bacterium]
MLRYTDEKGQYLLCRCIGYVLKSGFVVLFFSVILSINPAETIAARALYLQRPKLAFNISFEYDKDVRIVRSKKGEDSASRFREGLDIKTKGWFYHPALLVYSLNYSPEWGQSNSSGISGDENSFFHGYSGDMTLLQFKPYTVDVFAERTSRRIRSNFAETTRLNSDTYGGRLTLKYRFLPVVFGYDHIESSQTGFYESETDQDSFNLTMSLRNQRAAMSISSFYRDLNKVVNNQILDNEVKHANLRNSIVILKKNKLSFSSGVSYEESFSTNKDEEEYLADGTLVWRIKPNLKSSYTVNYENIDTFDKKLLSPIPRETMSHDLNLTHTLYENLATNINVTYEKLKIINNTDQRYGVGAIWDYKRRIPWGILRLEMGQSYRNVEVLESEDFVRVIDEIQRIDDVTVTPLANANVDFNIPVSVSDSLGTPLIEDFHYELIQIGDVKGIRCKLALPGCTAGVDVFVDYTYRSRFPFDYSIRFQLYGIRLDLWSRLKLHYNYSKLKQNFLRGFRPEELNQNIIHRAGAELEWKNSNSMIEVEDVDSVTGLSLRRTRLMESVYLKTANEWFLNITASYTINKYHKTDETVKVGNILASAEKLIFYNGKMRAEVFMRDVTGESQDLNNIGFSTFLNWIYNIYEIDLTYSFTNEKNSITDQTFRNHYLFLNLRRNLF